MAILEDVLPAYTSWTVVNGTMSASLLHLNAGGYAHCTLTTADLPDIPSSFQIFARLNRDVAWKTALIGALLEITYVSTDIAHTRVPFSYASIDAGVYVVENTVIVPSAEYTSMKFTIYNNSTSAVDLTMWELRPYTVPASVQDLELVKQETIAEAALNAEAEAAAAAAAAKTEAITESVATAIAAAGEYTDDAIVAASITTDQLVAGTALIGDALIADLSAGKITAGTIDVDASISIAGGGTTIDSTGVLVSRGNFRLDDGLEIILRDSDNLLMDHSAELLPVDFGTSLGTNTYLALPQGNDLSWVPTNWSACRVIATPEGDSFPYALFGLQALGISPSTINKWIHHARRLQGATEYTFSGYFSTYTNSPTTGQWRYVMRLEAGHYDDTTFEWVQDAVWETLSPYISLLTANRFVWTRMAVTTNTAIPAAADMFRCVVYAHRYDGSMVAGNTFMGDGFQLVPYGYPTAYDPEATVMSFLSGTNTAGIKTHVHTPLVYSGSSALIPNAYLSVDAVTNIAYDSFTQIVTMNLAFTCTSTMTMNRWIALLPSSIPAPNAEVLFPAFVQRATPTVSRGIVGADGLVYLYFGANLAVGERVFMCVSYCVAF